jgi:hypothetical protein
MTNAAVEVALELRVFDHQGLGQLMKVRGITTTELGVRCGRSAFTTKCYVEGRADPPAGVVALMAYALQVPVEALFRPASPDEVVMTTVVAPRRIRKT